MSSSRFKHPARALPARQAVVAQWTAAGAIALVCSGIARASLAGPNFVPVEQQRQWRALAIAPMSSGGSTGMPMAATSVVQPVALVPHRSERLQQPVAPTPRIDWQGNGPVRIRGSAGDGLYWSLRSAGASPQTAAQYLAALATVMDVGEVGPNDRFDMVLGSGGDLLYAGLERVGSPPIRLVRWEDAGRPEWVDPTSVGQASGVESAITVPVQGPITSYFGYRYHPILHFTRFHAGVDIGASWGSPIVAAGDGRVIGAGWSGGFGQEVQIAHGGGVTTIYGHMSAIVAQPGAWVHAGQLIGYVGSSGLSTGPHLHFEVRRGGTPVNPLSVRFASAPMKDEHLAAAVRERLQTLLGIGVRRS